MADTKRLFFGLSVQSPWSKPTPGGRDIAEASRHITLAFLGNVLYEPLKKSLADFPSLPHRLGPIAILSGLAFFPLRSPRVVAYQVDWLGKDWVTPFQQTLAQWLSKQGYDLPQRPFVPHITVARAPFVPKKWKDFFVPLPMKGCGLHLYESRSSLTYEPIWSIPLAAPFETKHHDGQRVLRIRGTNIGSLYIHAYLALCFQHPPLLDFPLKDPAGFASEETILTELNRMMVKGGKDHGCPLKAVSYSKSVEISSRWKSWDLICEI